MGAGFFRLGDLNMKSTLLAFAALVISTGIAFAQCNGNNCRQECPTAQCGSLDALGPPPVPPSDKSACVTPNCRTDRTDQTETACITNNCRSDRPGDAPAVGLFTSPTPVQRSCNGNDCK
jgi:hypothetical protein